MSATGPEEVGATLSPPDDAEEATPSPPARTVLPEGVRSRWDELAANAVRKRTKVEVRLREGTVPEETAEGDLRGTFLLFATGRTGLELGLGETKLFSEAIDLLASWVDDQAALGADSLREELKAHAKRLSVLDPADRRASKRLYVDFRDRILPLAWDNLVAAVTKERLEDFVRKLATDFEAELDLRALAAEARSLVAPMFEEKAEGTDAADPD